MREKQDYRNNLERLNEHFPNKEMLNISDISAYTGFGRKKVGNDWKKEFVSIGKSKYMPKTTLARLLSP